jgi:hypothetical protein
MGLPAVVAPSEQKQYRNNHESSHVSHSVMKESSHSFA